MRRALAAVFAIGALALTSCHAKSPAPIAPRVSASGALANRFVLADRASVAVGRLLVEVRATERKARPPVNLAVVVDTSGSMEGRAIDDARAACKALLRALAPQDRVAFVTFGSTTERVLPSTELADADLFELSKRIDAMRASGTTDMGGGLEAGLGEVAEHFVPEGVNRVLLLGDGDPNDAARVQAAAADAARKGISITTLGLGPDSDETELGRVAQLTGGTFHYVAESAKVGEFFSAEVVRLSKTAAKNASLELVPGPGVTIVDLAGRAGARSVALGDLGVDERREVVVHVNAPARRAGAAVELVDAILRYDDAASGARVETRVFLGAHAVASTAELERGRDADVEADARRIEAATATVEAIEDARQGDMARAKQALDRARENGSQVDDLEHALPSLHPTPAAPAPAAQSQVVRKAHDEAMQLLQAH